MIRGFEPFVLLAAALVVTSAPPRGDVEARAIEASKAAVRKAREAFNQAIARRDANAIGGILAPTYHIVTGRSDQFHGGEEEVGRWAERFRVDKTVTYRRTPREVTVNERWGLAEEMGEWSGNYTAAGVPVHASGVYAAKWQRAEGGQWLLQAEIFTTIKCEGSESGCVKPEPIRR